MTNSKSAESSSTASSISFVIDDHAREQMFCFYRLFANKNVIRNITATIVTSFSLMTLPQVSRFAGSTILLAHNFTVRKAHNSGRNHLANVREYYACVFSRFLSVMTMSDFVLYYSTWTRQSPEHHRPNHVRL